MLTLADVAELRRLWERWVECRANLEAVSRTDVGEMEPPALPGTPEYAKWKFAYEEESWAFNVLASRLWLNGVGPLPALLDLAERGLRAEGSAKIPSFWHNENPPVDLPVLSMDFGGHFAPVSVDDLEQPGYATPPAEFTPDEWEKALASYLQKTYSAAGSIGTHRRVVATELAQPPVDADVPRVVEG